MRDKLEEKINGYEKGERSKVRFDGDEETQSRQCEVRSMEIKGESTQTNTLSESRSSRLKNGQLYIPINQWINDDTCEKLCIPKRSVSTSTASLKAVGHQSEDFSQIIKSCKPENFPAYQEIQPQQNGILVKVTVTHQDSPERAISSSEFVHDENIKKSLSKSQKERWRENRDETGQNDILRREDLVMGPTVESNPCLHSELYCLPSFFPAEENSQTIEGIKKENDNKAEHEKESNRLEEWFDKMYQQALVVFANASSDLNFMFTLPLLMLDDAADYLTNSAGNSKQKEDEANSTPRRELVEYTEEASPVDYLVASISRCASIPRHTVVPVTTRDHKSSLERIQTPFSDQCDLLMENYSETSPEHEERTCEPPRSNTASLSLSEFSRECSRIFITGHALKTKEEKNSLKSKQACGLFGTGSTAERIPTDLALPQCDLAYSRTHNSESGNTSSTQRIPDEGRSEDATLRSNTDLCFRNEPDEQLSTDSLQSSERNADTKGIGVPLERHHFPPNKKQQQPYIHLGPDLSFKEMHPKKSILHRLDPNSKSQQRRKWFSVRRIQRSIQQRWRKDEKNSVRDITEYEAVKSQDLTPAPSIHAQETKKSVRFDKELTEVHFFEPTENSEDDESQNLFNYYYDLLTSKEEHWSVEEGDDSYADSSTEDENQCLIEFDGGPPFVCRGFALEENKTPDDDDDSKLE
eukprot:scaffold8728_cov164-Amphora_coffeaeformis.AAC.16